MPSQRWDSANLRVGILGGTFNPVHYGHLRAAQEVKEKASLDTVVFIPSGQPPLKSKDLASPHHRMQMVRLAIASNPVFSVSEIEISGEGKSYTVSTISALKKLYPADQLFFITGSDAFVDMPNWKAPDSIISSINLIVAHRPGTGLDKIKDSQLVKGISPASDSAGVMLLDLISGAQGMLVPVTQMDISSSYIRSQIRNGMSLKYLLPPEVQEYISINKLYLE
ncbi:MAG: nicotinate-nucleotide adenylyltransferase [Nitrospirae bacterium]|nr:nicotinate-nucleotide adenylyltransferase [Nitrospirota bacterium]